MPNPLQDQLNKIKWDKNELHMLVFLIQNRPIDVVLGGERVFEIAPNGLWFREQLEGDLVWIPYHRIRKISHGDVVLYERDLGTSCF